MSRLLSLLVLTAILSISVAYYDEFIAAELAHASYSSYCDADRLRDFKCGKNCDYLVGYQLVNHKEFQISYKHNISYTTFVNNQCKRFIVAFRGTSNVIQLFKEFIYSKPVSCPLSRTEGAKVSTYFLNFYATYFSSDVMAHMQEAAQNYTGYDFYITGHSLGGAFATIATLQLSAEGVIPKERLNIYTFRSPRVGNRIFARAVTKGVQNAFRIVHDADIVPHVPPCMTDNLRRCVAPEQEDNHAHEGFFGWHRAPEIH